MAATTLKWVPLPAFENSIPALIVSPNFGTNTYKLHVSDLANVWTESLDRKAIFTRSIQEDTSIDLTEGPDQMTILLNYLQAAFDMSSPQHHQTKLTLEAAPKGGLVLLITCTLPGGLKPLKWPVNLTKQLPASLASELVLPLVQSQQARAHEIENLIATLHQKDAVITKLVEKLDAVGTGLEDVFNALSGKRKISRLAAGTKVNGLAPFNESEWRLAMSQGAPAPGDAASLVQDVLGGPNAIHLKDSGIRASDDLNDWWEHMGAGPVPTLVQESTETIEGGEKDEVQQKEETPTDDDDDFQVQATPPHLASKRRQQHDAGHDDGTTEDDGSCQEDRAHRKEARINPTTCQVPHPDSSATFTSRRRRCHGIGRWAPKGEIAPPSSPPKPPPSPRKRGGLGTIGGRSKTVTRQSRSPSLDQNRGATTASTAKPKAGRLGVIGKRRPEEQAQQSSSKHAGQELSEESETEEQVAERRRAELAKDLERKAAAAPAKKKRRF
ncbi:hypothetical protein PG994_008685 [Apiospora phragmitis]|uniref:Non-homologous end-joining factor 1 n=1 Tax=Apiospora phragmitis TaxID=2905665 RepID=A0ABR1UHQ6_9PEZI